MNPTLKNILAVVAGLIVGSIVNMAIITIGPHLILPPQGGDMTTMEGLKASMHLMEPKHFLFPFLAHAIGTMAGAFLAARIAATRKMRIAVAIGIAFLIGGITNVIMLPSPVWFTCVDLLLAYLPFAYYGGFLATRQSEL